MDLNYLYHRHGVSLMMAARARCADARTAHGRLAAGYADKISATIRANGAAVAR